MQVIETADQGDPAMKSGFGMSEEVRTYVVEHGSPPDAILQRLAERTQDEAGPFARMQIDPEQGAFLTWLVQVVGAERALEIGTFTGYSAICISRGLSEGGQLTCLDISEEWTTIGRQAWAEAGLEDRIELRLGPAAETLAAMPAETQFDFAFIDADKTGYEVYLDLVDGLLRHGGVVVVDNVLRRGAVINDEAQDDDTVAIRTFNDARRTDDRWDTVMLPVGDGLTLLRKR